MTLHISAATDLIIWGTAGRYWRLKEATLRTTCLSLVQEQFQLKGLALYIFIATYI
jgi:hypothetical protein